MKNILSSLNESEKRRILEMHYNSSQKQYLIEEADITVQVVAAYNQILTTLRGLIKNVPGTTDSPVTFGNPIIDASNTNPNRKLYNIEIKIGGPRPLTFTIKVGSTIDVIDPSKVLNAWQNYLISDFKNAINSVESNESLWTTLKNGIVKILDTKITLAKPTIKPQKP